MPIELAPHQHVAVDRAITLLRARGGLLLADDVGLGKSFVAAAVARALGGEIQCVVPAGLVEQWHRTLDAFGVAAAITTHDRIINEPFAPRADVERLVIVDEAHAFRNPETQRYGALTLRCVGVRLLLVTATPICNTPDDLYALISLIAADDGLRAEGVPSIEEAFRLRRGDEIAVVMRELVIRRGRDVLGEALQFGALQRSVVRYDVPDVPIDTLQFPLIGGTPALLRGILWRRLESSAAALIESLRRQKRFYERALDCLATGRTLTKRDYRIAFADDEADAFQEVLFWEMFASADARADADEIRAEIGRIEKIRQQAAGCSAAKLQSLLDICTSSIAPILIFTSAIATARDLFAAIGAVRRTALITSRGAQPLNAVDAFQGGAIDVLVATDLAAEGLNMQRAGVVVHYDMPWNPVKLDQRNGRAFRIGQERDFVRAIYFLPRTRHTRIVQTITAKNRVRRRLLSVSTAEGNAVSRSVLTLPVRLTRAAPAVALYHALRRARITPPPALVRRYRGGAERLVAAMAVEYLDAQRLSDLTALLERERIIDGGASLGPADR